MQDMDDKEPPEKPLISALDGVTRTRVVVARELRAMAAAEGRPYRLFEHIDPWIKNIWLAAAELLEADNAA